MSLNIFIFLLCVVICGSAVENEPILQQISSYTSDCNTDNHFKNFDLSKVPQFGAMCNNIQIPDKKQLDFLLLNNVIPILCMGLYDVSLKLCQTNNILEIKEIFPPTIDRFNEQFKKLDEVDKFSSLDKFCSSTVRNYTVKESASNVTEFWWGVLNQKLNDKESCMSMCRTNKINKVQPLCSYIIWSNGIYQILEKNEKEEALAIGKQENEMPEGIVGLAKEEETNEAMPPEFENHLGSEPIKKTQALDSTISSSDQKPTVQVKVLSVAQNITTKFIGNVSGVNEVQGIPQESTVEEPLNTTPEKAIGNTNKTNTIISANPDLKPTKVDKGKKKKIKKKLPVEEEQLSPPEGNVDEGIKVDTDNSKTVISNLQTDDQNKPKTDKTVDPIADTFANTPQVAGSETPIETEKDVQLAPYPDGGEDDDDGDDFEVEPEGPVKTTPNKTGQSKVTLSKFGIATNDQVVAEPDKAYNDREILIEDHFIEAEDSHFFTYFLCMAVLTIMAYLAFHNKKKLVALAVEGRKTRGSRRRPNCSNYSKLDCSLEEAMVSNTTASVTHVLY